ncbi:uncharacterized protein LOC144539389 [Centroberyx gerrardi]
MQIYAISPLSSHTQDSGSVETQERAYPHSQQQQASIKQQLVNVLQELELQRSVWEERGEKVEERQRAREQEQKQKQSQSENQTQIQAQTPEAKKVAVVNWWKALRVEGAKAKPRTGDAQSSQALAETQAKLQRAEQTITDMREQVCHLQVALRTAQECVTEQKTPQVGGGVLHIDKGTNTAREEPDRVEEKVVKDQRDAAVATDPVDNTGGAATQEEQTQVRVTADGLLMTLRRMEAMVSGALEAAELVRQSEQRVSQVKARMESITQKVEEALGQAADTENQLSVLEARITESTQTQPPSPREPTDLGSDLGGFPAESDVEAEDRESPRSPSPPPVVPEVADPLPMNDIKALWYGQDEKSLEVSYDKRKFSQDKCVEVKIKSTIYVFIRVARDEAAAAR